MSTLTILPPLLLTLRLTFISLFAFAFVTKVKNPVELERTIRKFNLLKLPYTPAVVWFILALECVISLLLIFNYLFIGFVLSFILLLLFSAALVAVLSSGKTTACNCFGSQSAPVSAWTLGRNGLLLLSAGIGVWLTTALDAPMNFPSFKEVAIAAPLSLLATFLVINLETIKEILFAR
jgi:hypothetical protein